MNEKMIRDAYCKIRTIDQTISDDILDFMKDASIEKLNQINNNFISSNVETKYLILSGEGNVDTEHQFCMELSTLEEAVYEFERFKLGEFKDTYLFIYEAKKIRES